MKSLSGEEKKFDKSWYDLLWPNSNGNPEIIRGVERQVVSMLSVAGETPESTKGKSCLELGCGTVEATIALVKKYGLRVTAVDYNEHSLALAKKLIEQNGFSQSVTFITQDLQTLELGNSTFDFVISKGVLHHLHDPEKAVARGLMYLKKDGKCIFRVNWLYGWMFKKKSVPNYAFLKLMYVLFPNPQKRMKVGEKLFGKRLEGKPNREAVIFEYGSMYKPMRLVTFLKWFKKNNIDFINSDPDHSLHTLFKKVFSITTSSKKPSFFSRTIVQCMYMFILRTHVTLTVVGRKILTKSIKNLI